MANLLQYETSPYLLQHAHNPVHWQPWGDAAFAQAEKEQKPVLVSIGYATCHWCHVMERESFENDEVAAYMNEHFICIKVDREEHPDIDHFYMDALKAMKQSGGWPLNMFVTPQRKPFYGGTYFPPQKLYHRPSWMEILEAVQLTWQKKQAEIEHQSQQLLSYLQQTYLYESSQQETQVDTSEIVAQIAVQYDSVNGGFSMAPKFPNFSVIRLLLHLGKVEKHEQAVNMALHSLSKMTTSGIYDPVAGGLCRYATDNEWRIPHFEKMLYDNALLISALSAAYANKQQKEWMHLIHQISAFCRQTLLDEQDGLFASAMDADSEGEEGKFYVWSYEELKGMNSFHEALAKCYDLHEEGNWEEKKNILHQVVTDAEILETFEFLPKQWTLMKQQFLMELWHVRSTRVAPIVDTKKILSLNALLATSYFQAYKALGVAQYCSYGQDLLTAMVQHFIQEDGEVIGHLPLKAKGAKVILAKLDDLTYLLQALIQGYSSTGNAVWLTHAQQVMQYLDDYFLDEQGVMYYFSDKRQTDVLVRKIEQLDGAILSSNAIMSENLWLMGQMMTNLSWEAQAKKMTNIMIPAAKRYPVAYATWLHNAIRMQGIWSVVKKNEVVDSFEHTIFYQQFLEQKLLIEEIENAQTDALEAVDTANNNKILFQECFSGQCKTPVNSIFQLF